jgi:hypothetical protein
MTGSFKDLFYIYSDHKVDSSNNQGLSILVNSLHMQFYRQIQQVDVFVSGIRQRPDLQNVPCSCPEGT